MRREAHALADACETELSSVHGVAVQQLAAPALAAAAGALRQARTRIETEPKQALEALGGVRAAIAAAVNRAEADAKAWSDAESERRARTDALASRLAVSRSLAGPSATAALAQVDAALSTARGDTDAATADAALDTAEARLEDVRDDALEEDLRRTVVQTLFTTLKGMGFIVARPSLAAPSRGTDEPTSKVVVLDGQMPSGRRARFEVALDGRLAFDLDGYPGRACAADLEQVTRTLEERFDGAVDPPQVQWTVPPERIGKSARDLPDGGHTGGMGGQG